METKHATNRIAEIEAHNARVETIRKKSLSSESVKAIDTMIERADYLYCDIMESLYSGSRPNLTTDELVDFHDAITALRKQFAKQEINEYLRERAKEEATWGDEE